MNLEKGKLYYNPENLLEAYYFNGNNLESVSGEYMSPASLKIKLIEITSPLDYLLKVETKYSEVRSFVMGKFFPEPQEDFEPSSHT